MLFSAFVSAVLMADTNSIAGFYVLSYNVLMNRKDCMKNGKKLIILGLLVLLCASFVTCYNPIMEKWWPEPVTKEGKKDKDTETSGYNFAVVVFNTDGGVAADGTVPLPVRVLWGNTIPRIRAITKTVGTTPYGFAGWMDENGKPWDINTRVVKQEDDVDKDDLITLTAKWDLQTYKVEFVGNFDVFANPPLRQNHTPLIVEDQIIAHGCKANEPSVIPTGDGHGLVGWYTQNGDYHENDLGGNTGGWGKKWDFVNDVVTKDTVLYARWSLYTRTVHLQVNGGNRPDGSTISRVNFTIFTGSLGAIGCVIIDVGPITRDGYKFGGWYTR